MKKYFKYIVLSILVSFVCNLYCQNVYKTPRGERYHLGSCRMVENVSEKITSKEVIQYYKLTPCKICDPPVIENLHWVEPFAIDAEALGQVSESYQCMGITKSGSRCQHKTRIKGGYCYQHGPEQNRINQDKNGITDSKLSYCGASTQKGTPCSRVVKEGGLCYQHREK